MTEELPHDDVLMSAILDEPLPPDGPPIRRPPPPIARPSPTSPNSAPDCGSWATPSPATRPPTRPRTLPVPPVPPARPPTRPPARPRPRTRRRPPSPLPPPPRPEPPAPRRVARPAERDGRRIARRFAVGVSALTCVAALAAGVSWLNATGGLGASSESAKAAGEPATRPLPSDADRKGDNASLGPEGFVACSRLIFEGTVTRVEPVPGVPRDRITLDVERHYKPDKGPGRITVTMDHDVDPRLTPGQRTLISVPKGEDHPDNWATGEDMAELRELVVGALPGAKAIECDGAGPRG